MNPSNIVNIALAGVAAATLNFTDALATVSLDPCTVAYTLSILAMLGVKVDIGRFILALTTKPTSGPGAGGGDPPSGPGPKE